MRRDEQLGGARVLDRELAAEALEDRGRFEERHVDAQQITKAMPAELERTAHGRRGDRIDTCTLHMHLLLGALAARELQRERDRVVEHRRDVSRIDAALEA